MIEVRVCFFDFTLFRYSGQKAKNNFVVFLGQMRANKFASEIYRHGDPQQMLVLPHRVIVCGLLLV